MSQRGRDPEASIEMRLLGVEAGEPTAEGFVPVEISTSRGAVQARYFPAERARAAVLTVGGAGGGWDTPVKGWLYPRLCEELSREGMACLRVRYRRAADLVESTLDVLAGLAFLAGEGIERAGLVGHSFGGAVVIQAAAHAPEVVAIAPLSTQSYGAEPARDLAPRCAVLLMHGLEDEILPPACSEMVHRISGEPKRLVLLPGTRHGLDEAAEEVFQTTKSWMLDHLERGLESVKRAG